jgi:DNA helicase HerA-like ATPase
MAESLSAAGVPVFVADVKSDLAGLAMPLANRTTGSIVRGLLGGLFRGR